MSRPLPSLNALRAFEAVARHKSFTKAAHELNVTRAAVSHQIKHLEDYLGISLVERHTRSIELTSAGAASLPKLRDGFNSLADAVHLMQTQSGVERISVSMAPSFASKWLMPRLHRFSERFPDIDMEIAEDAALIVGTNRSGDSMEKLFRTHDVDVVIRFGSGNYRGCRVDRLFSVDAVPLCHPSLVSNEHPHPLKKPSDLAHHPLLHDETSYEGRPSWGKWLKVNKVKGVNANRGMHFNQISLAMSAAVDAQGVLLSMRPLAKYDIEAGRLCIPFDLSLPLEHAYHAITPEAAETNKHAVKVFLEWLTEEVARDQGQETKGL